MPSFTQPKLFLITAATLLSCTITSTPAQSKAPASPQLEVITNTNVAQAIDQINNFTFAFSRRQSASPTKNDIASPLSLVSAFALLYPGTSGQVKSDLDHYFHFNQGINEVAALMKTINGRKNHSARIANSLWLDRNLTVKPGYQSTLQQLFASQTHQVNFSNPQAAAAAINAWAQEYTSGFIRQVVTRDDIKKNNFALVNAIYFHAKWIFPFLSRDTRMQSFYTSPNISTRVHMMYQERNFGYYNDHQVQVIDLPYQGHQYEMRVILPRAGVSIRDVQNKLSASLMHQWDHKMTYDSNVHLSLPRFSVTKKMYLKKWFKKHGLSSLFDGKHTSDYKPMTDGHILLDKVIQKAKIEVNEQGTKAAAVTVIGGMMTSTAVFRFPDPQVIFNANHPFIYVIRDKASGCVLFTGIERSPA